MASANFSVSSYCLVSYCGVFSMPAGMNVRLRAPGVPAGTHCSRVSLFRSLSWGGRKYRTSPGSASGTSPRRAFSGIPQAVEPGAEALEVKLVVGAAGLVPRTTHGVPWLAAEASEHVLVVLGGECGSIRPSQYERTPALDSAGGRARPQVAVEQPAVRTEVPGHVLAVPARVIASLLGR